MPVDREFDIVLVGATGFTGGLTAAYLARHGPPGLRWALAGRNPRRLAERRHLLSGIAPACADLPLVTVDAADPTSVRALAERTRAVATTVGPFLTHGEPLVAACAEAGTDYLDITGEPEFVDSMYLRHHATAQRSGARLVHACGFDSVPHDLGVYVTVGQLPPDVPITVDGYVRAGGRFSTGTYQSAVTALGRPWQMARVARQRRRVEPRPDGRRVRAGLGRVGRSAALDSWVLPLPTLDPQVVARSAAALAHYGPDFTYRHQLVVRRLPAALAGTAAVGAVAALAQIPPARRWLVGRAAPGRGPSEQQRASGWFAVRFVGRGGGRQVVTEVAGGDPGYDETAKMLAESALCLVRDDLPETAGQVTTATAMGDALVGRLERAGISFTTLSVGDR